MEIFPNCTLEGDHSLPFALNPRPRWSGGPQETTHEPA
jgi:hypothetical protein